MSESQEFDPQWTSPPGETLVDILSERRIRIDEFAQLLGQTLPEAQLLLDGVAPLDSTTAKKLSGIVGGSPEFWCNRESQFRAAISKVARQDENEAGRDWLRAIPLGEIYKVNWLRHKSSAGDRLCDAFRFFGISSIEEWRRKYNGLRDRVALRTSPSFDSAFEALVTWLRFGEIEASKSPSDRWDSELFSSILPEIRSLTRKRSPETFLPELKDRCRRCGVNVIVCKTPSKCQASGATFFTFDGRPVMMLSFRYRSDDQFWFTFFHEAGHLLLHSEESYFLEFDSSSNSQEEQEANAFAGEILIPEQYRAAMMQLGSNAKRIMRFARDVGLSPGIVVGQMQHFEILAPHQQSALKRRYIWDGDQICLNREKE